MDYKLCLAATNVANSEDLRNIEHDYYIIDTDKEAKTELIRIKEADEAIVSYKKMTTVEMRDVLKVLGFKTTSMSEDLTITTLRKLIDENPKKFNDVINDPNYKDRVFIKKLENYNILRKQGTKFYYGDQANILGNNIEEVIDFLNDKGNSAVVVELKKRLQTEEKAK